MKVLQEYFNLQQKIFDYFGYVEDWCVIPLEDHTRDYWMIVGDEDYSSTFIVWSPIPLTKDSINDGNKIYSGLLYTQRFLPKWIYRKEDYTMISVNTQCDGNKFLMVFDNKKECYDESLKQHFQIKWGH